MKLITEFLSELRRLEVKLWIDGERLRYSATPGTLTPEIIEEMRSRKSEILAFLRQVNSETPTSIQPVSRTQNLPLSFAQQRLWFLDRLEGKSPAYNISMALRLQGQLNVTALEQALKAIVERHEVLRTNFSARNGNAIAIVHTSANFCLNTVDLRMYSECKRDVELQKLIDNERLQPFDLENDSLIRSTLLCLDEKEHIFLWTLHHIICDGWSINLLYRELSILYSNFFQGHSSSLPELPIQYIDFVCWQREWQTGKAFENQLSYWKKQLNDIPPLLELPLDFPRLTMQTFAGTKQYQVLNQTLSEALKTLSQRQGVTLFMTLLTAFKVLLSRYSGSQDIVVGTPVAGRNRPELENLIGFFVNTVVLRTQLDGNLSYQELLGRVREATLGAYQYQEMPLEKLVEEVKPERNLSYNPLFQVLFNMINIEFEAIQMPELKVELMPSSEVASKFDLTLYVREQTGEIKLDWVYNRDLFKTETIALMKERFQTLLESIVVAPEQPIDNLPLLNETERKKLQTGKNTVRPSQPYPAFPKSAIEQSIPTRFEEQVRKYPRNLAVCTQNHQWTYQTLNNKANAIAQFLLNFYGNVTEKIALLLEPDALAIAAILGVLKSGKTYVPLDPTYPKLRLNYILEDCQATLIITNHQNLAFAEELTQKKIPVVNLDEIDFNQTINEIKATIAPNTLAYILYTSGSTGQPKGVIQNHRNILHFIRNYTNNLHIASSDRLTLLASYSFDAAIIDIFAALLNGATLYPINLKRESLAHLSEWLDAQEITIYHSTPTVYRQFLRVLATDLIAKTKFPKLRLIVLGGEEVVKSDVELYQKYFSDECILVNGLGCTESSFNLQYLINKNTQITQNFVPVGYPFDDTEILLLNEAGNPTDVWGEIAIKSPHIALGYWQKSELTQAAFLPDPQGGNCRIYRTGDLGRLRTDGSLEFLGRRDFQVKIRGFRIELGEIEATLAQHPFVREAVVIASKELSKDKHLVAYIVAHSESVPTTAELRDFLQDRLPNYMVPTVFVLLDTLPLTPNGKIDRRALPVSDLVEQKSTQIFVAPTNDIELRLVKIWEKVLGVQPISTRDNFFELGGHSLVAVELFSQIQEIMGVDIPISTLFKAPTIEKLAQIISQEGWSTSWLSLVPIKPEGSQPPFFFHGGAAEAMTWAKFGRQLASDRPFYGLQIPALNGTKIFQSSVEEIASLCVKEIKTIQPNGPYFIGGHCFGGTVAFEIAQQLKAQDEEVAMLALVDAYAPKIMPKSNLLLRIRTLQHSLIFLIYKTFYYHADKLKQKNLAGQLNYLKDWLQKKVNAQSTKSKVLVDKKDNHRQFQPVENLQNLENFIPYEVRYLQVEKMNREAKAKYKPQVYPGNLLLFRASKQNFEWYFGEKLGWEDLALSGVEVYEIPGIFGNLFNAASMPFLVQEMQNALDQRQNVKVEKL